MDRILDLRERRRLGAAKALRALLALGALAGLLVFLPGWLRPGLERSNLRILRVERGSVEAALGASGTVLPAFERILTAPIDTRVLRVLLRPGAALHAGDPILELDTAAARLEIGRLDDAIAKTRNQQEQLRLGLELRLVQLGGQAETARADLEVIASRTEQSRKLGASGLLSAATLRAAEAELKKARISLEQIERMSASERRAAESQLRGLELDVGHLAREREESARQLELATARAPSDGVLTWVTPTEGAALRKGEPFARVADLGSFRVEATASDLHASRLGVGLPVRVTLDGQSLAGSISAIDPTLENGAVKFTVALAEPSSPLLRNNLRVDVYVVTGSHPRALRVRRGPFLRGTAEQSVFVLTPSSDRAVRRIARLGVSDAESVEILSGLEEGESIIANDLRDFEGFDAIQLR